MPASLAMRRASGEAKVRFAVGCRAGRGGSWRARPARGSAGSSADLPSAFGCVGRRQPRLSAASALAGAAAAPPSAAAAGILALAGQHGDQRVDLDAFGAGRNDDLGDRALVDGLDFHRRLVGLDLGDHVARRDLVAFLDQPLGEIALFHRGRQGRHGDVDRHVSAVPPALGSAIGRRLCTASTTFADIRQQGQLFEVGRVGHRHVLAGDGDDRRVEIVEGALR